MAAKVNSTENLHQGLLFKLVKENITLENGRQTEMEIIRHPGAALVVPYDNGKFYMIKQYRHAVADHIWEFPAGTLDDGEAAEDCAKRELIEEIGYSADNWHLLGKLAPVPGYSDETIQVYLAQNLEQKQQNLDHDELLEVHEFNLAEVQQKIFGGAVYDCKTIAAFALAQNHLKLT